MINYNYLNNYGMFTRSQPSQLCVSGPQRSDFTPRPMSHWPHHSAHCQPLIPSDCSTEREEIEKPNSPSTHDNSLHLLPTITHTQAKTSKGINSHLHPDNVISITPWAPPTSIISPHDVLWGTERRNTDPSMNNNNLCFIVFSSA